MLMVKLVVAPGPSSPQPPTEPSAVKSHISASYFILFCFVLFYFLVFRDRVSLCSSGCPGTHSVDQAGLKLRNPPASVSQVLVLKACVTTARQYFFIKRSRYYIALDMATKYED